MTPPIQLSLVASFMDAVEEASQEILSLSVRRTALSTDHRETRSGEFSGIIGLYGATTGTCMLSLSAAFGERLARAVRRTSTEHGITPQEISEGLCTLLDRVVMIAGARLENTLFRFNTTLPGVVSGEEGKLFYRADTQHITMIFETDKSEILALDLWVVAR